MGNLTLENEDQGKVRGYSILHNNVTGQFLNSGHRQDKTVYTMNQVLYVTASSHAVHNKMYESVPQGLCTHILSFIIGSLDKINHCKSRKPQEESLQNLL